MDIGASVIARLKSKAHTSEMSCGKFQAALKMHSRLFRRSFNLLI